MKNLVVYYTRTGNTETVAKQISKMVSGEIRKIELTKSIGFGWAGFTSLLGLNGKIKDVDYNLQGYDNIFIGCQVWAGKSSTPMNTFLNNADFSKKNVYVFITLADSKEPTAAIESIVKRIKEKGGNVVDTIYIQTNMKKPMTEEQAGKAVADWVNKNIASN